MDIRDFKSGTYRQEYEYKSFLPGKVARNWIISDGELQSLLSQADRRLGELSAFSQLVPNVDFFIQMHVSKEATMSSRIEGTRTNIEDALQKLEDIDPEKRDDWVEVHNYIEAMNQAIPSLEKLPLTGRLLRDTHRTLMQGVRGSGKQPGDYRRSQNWIGGASLKDAVFVPPPHHEVPDLMADLERFLNNHDHPLPDLIRIGIAHYQFETIHPFLDGNGRIGRLLITLYLVNRGLLTKPSLYLSAFFEKNRMLYYDNLSRTRTHHELNQWLKFFLEGIRQTSEDSIQTFKAIIALRERYEKTLLTLGRKTELARKALHMFFAKPIVDVVEIGRMLSIGTSTAFRLVDDFEKLGILKETTGFQRNRVFIFQEYVDLFKGNTA